LKKFLYLILCLFYLPIMSTAQITGLAGWDIFIDPGHSQNANMPQFNWAISEAKRNVRVALQLRGMLLNETDIDTVYLSRTNDQQYVSLLDRSIMANNLGASWFHSIHSDAGSANKSSTLLLYGESSPGVEKTPNGGKAMSDIMIDNLTDGMRTYTVYGSIGDCSFYGTSSGPYLSVNRNTTMPSELSESGYHTNVRQNQLFMNNEWRRMEARTFFWSILDFHGIDRPFIRILAGIISNKEDGIPVNGAVIKVNDREYTTDTFESLFNQYTSDPDLLSNGFYYFEDIESDSLKIVVEAENYYSDSANVKMIDDFFTFKDFGLVSKIAPGIISSNITEGDTSVSVLEDVVINFSRPMNAASVDSAFSIQPAVSGSISWNSAHTQLVFPSDSLEFKTQYTIAITAQAKDQYGHLLDGNLDGQPGDDYTLSFRTGYDIKGPEIESLYPANSVNNVELRPIVSISYDEIIEESSVTDSVFKLERISDESAVPGELVHYISSAASVLNFFPDSKLHPGETYEFKTSPGLRDRYGNENSEIFTSSFVTGNTDWQERDIEKFESGFESYWWQPGSSGSTGGTKSSPPVYRASNSDITNLLSNSTRSMEIFYNWDMSAGSWLIREYLSGGSARAVQFDNSYTLQCYIFGDGSNTRFRFAIDEKLPATSASYHEVSPWYTISWHGWKLGSWDLSSGQTGTWLGNGNIEGKLRFDSIQLSYQSGASESGKLYFDDLHLIKEIEASAIQDKEAGYISDYRLMQNYPNPFNPETTISFTLPQPGKTTLKIYDLRGRETAVLVNKNLSAGSYSVTMDGSNMASGVYIYEMRSKSTVMRKRMVLIK